ncbi:MAG: DUF2974 domain-containing protein [Slackia sp.]|nr:DUF2974 domain-containing protein [Slackia sp.]
MRTIMDYLATEFATFEEAPFCAVDALVLSEFCMVRMEHVLPPMRDEDTIGGKAVARLRSLLPRRGVHFRDALLAEHYDDMFVGLMPDKVKELMLALAASPRFRDMEMSECASVFDEEENTQFAALSFTYKNEFAFVGFRGTDCSFTGWREDFDMAYMNRVPAQESSLRYLEAVMRRLPKKVYVGGHSKGGNLALYAAAMCGDKTARRISKVFSFDAPGFRPGVLGKAQRDRLSGMVERYVPHESLIGMLMDCPVPYAAVRSSAAGAWQHDPFSWGVDGFDFERCSGLASSAQFAHDVIGRWLARYDEDEAREIVDALFDAMRASGAHDFSDVLKFGPKTFSLLRDAAKNTDDATRVTLTAAIGDLAEAVAHRAWFGQEGEARERRE